MFFYRVILQHGNIAPQDYSHHETLDAAHTAAKSYDKVNERPHVRIEQIDVRTDKEGVLSLLRGYCVEDGSVTDMRDPVIIRRVWELSARGGLAELDEAEVRELGRDIYGDGAMAEDEE